MVWYEPHQPIFGTMNCAMSHLAPVHMQIDGGGLVYRRMGASPIGTGGVMWAVGVRCLGEAALATKKQNLGVCRFSLTRLVLEGFLLYILKGSGMLWPWKVPPNTASRFPQP